MSFQAPLFLAGLAVVPIALAALLLARRRPAKYVVRFPAAATLAAVMPKSSTIRRNVPPALLLHRAGRDDRSRSRGRRRPSPCRSRRPRSCSSPTRRAR